MNGLMDCWMDGFLDGWKVNCWMDGWKDGLLDGWIVGWKGWISGYEVWHHIGGESLMKELWSLKVLLLIEDELKLLCFCMNNYQDYYEKKQRVGELVNPLSCPFKTYLYR